MKKVFVELNKNMLFMISKQNYLLDGIIIKIQVVVLKVHIIVVLEVIKLMVENLLKSICINVQMLELTILVLMLKLCQHNGSFKLVLLIHLEFQMIYGQPDFCCINFQKSTIMKFLLIQNQKLVIGMDQVVILISPQKR